MPGQTVYEVECLLTGSRDAGHCYTVPCILAGEGEPEEQYLCPDGKSARFLCVLKVYPTEPWFSTDGCRIFPYGWLRTTKISGKLSLSDIRTDFGILREKADKQNCDEGELSRVM